MMSEDKYVNPEVHNVEESLARDGRRLQLKYKPPLSSKYYIWLKELPELKVYGLQCFQELIYQISWPEEILTHLHQLKISI